MYVERRIMYFDIPIRDVINCILPMKEWTRVVENNLPEGTRILDVHINNQRGVFEFLIHHPDFEEVIPGCMPRAFVFTMQSKEIGGSSRTKCPFSLLKLRYKGECIYGCAFCEDIDICPGNSDAWCTALIEIALEPKGE